MHAKGKCSVCGKAITPIDNRPDRKCRKCYVEESKKTRKYVNRSKKKLCPECKNVMIWPLSTMCVDCRHKKDRTILDSLLSGVIPSGQKCNSCGVELTKDNWKEIEWRYGNVNYKCYTCRRKLANKNLAKHYYKYQARQRALKREVIDHYGGECQCCHEKNIGFLSLDHINNDGGKRRRNNPDECKIYKWSKDHNYPTDLRVMCYNCNIGRMRNGGVCPHELERQRAQPA